MRAIVFAAGVGMCALLALRTGHAQAPLPTITEVEEPSATTPGTTAEEDVTSPAAGGSGAAGIPDRGVAGGSVGVGRSAKASDAGTGDGDVSSRSGEDVDAARTGGGEEGGAAQRSRVATSKDVEALREELLKNRATLEETQAQVQELQQQLSSQGEQVATSDARALTHMMDAQAESRDGRVAELQRALLTMEELGALLVAGEDDIEDRVVTAAQTLIDARDDAAQWGSAPEADALLAAIEALDRVPALIASRNFHLANIALFGAQQHTRMALTLAQGARGPGR